MRPTVVSVAPLILIESDVCRACGWRSERSFTSWGDHFDGADVEGYLNRSSGLSDRLDGEKDGSVD